MRPTTSCDRCRSKKIKCDHLRPTCSNCYKKGVCCQYESKWLINSSSRSQNIQINIPVIHHHHITETVQQLPAFTIFKEQEEVFDNEEIDFYLSNYDSPISFSQGPLSWISLTKKDRFLNMISRNLRLENSINKEDKLIETSGKSSIEDFEKIEFCSNETVQLEKSDLVTDIEAVLPNKKQLWSYFDIFFDSQCYLEFPYVEKQTLLEKLDNIIGTPEYTDKPVKLKISNLIDLTIIGILLIILKAVSLSIYNFGKDSNVDDTTNFLIDNPIPTECTSKLILMIKQELSIIIKPPIDMVQFTCMKYCLDLYSPYEFSCLHITNAYKLGELIQYSTQNSLEIDPDSKHTISNIGKTEKDKNLSRRLWNMVVYFDSLRFITSGYPILVDKASYNTKFPDEHLMNSEVLKLANQWTKERIESIEKFYPVLKMVLNIRKNISIGKLKFELLPVINYINQLSSIEEILRRPNKELTDKFENYKRLVVLIQSNTLLFTFYYHLFLFYSEKRTVDLSIYYLIQLIKITKILYKPLLFMDPNKSKFNFYKQFGPAIFIFPTLETAFRKVTSMFLAILVRVKALKTERGNEIDTVILTVLDEIIDLIDSAFTYELVQFMNTSDTYYHTWLLSKVQTITYLKALKVSKGPYQYNDEDANCKQIISQIDSSTEEDSGDLGFKNYSVNDLRKILDELKGFEEYFNDNKPIKESLLQKLDQKLMTDNDRKWLHRLLKELGIEHKLFRARNKTNNVPDEFFQAQLNEINNIKSFNFDSLDFDGLFNFGAENFFRVETP